MMKRFSVFVPHTLKEEMRNMQTQLKQILQEQEEKREDLGKMFEQVQVRGVCRCLHHFVKCTQEMIPLICV